MNKIKLAALVSAAVISSSAMSAEIYKTTAVSRLRFSTATAI